MTLATSLPLQMPSQRESSAAREKKERSSGGAETDSDDVTVVLRVSLDPLTHSNRTTALDQSIKATILNVFTD